MDAKGYLACLNKTWDEKGLLMLDVGHTIFGPPPDKGYRLKHSLNEVFLYYKCCFDTSRFTSFSVHHLGK